MRSVFLHVQVASSWQIPAIKAADLTIAALENAARPLQPIKTALAWIRGAAASGPK